MRTFFTTSRERPRQPILKTVKRITLLALVPLLIAAGCSRSSSSEPLSRGANDFLASMHHFQALGVDVPEPEYPTVATPARVIQGMSDGQLLKLRASVCDMRESGLDMDDVRDKFRETAYAGYRDDPSYLNSNNILAMHTYSSCYGGK